MQYIFSLEKGFTQTVQFFLQHIKRKTMPHEKNTLYQYITKQTKLYNIFIGYYFYDAPFLWPVSQGESPKKTGKRAYLAQFSRLPATIISRCRGESSQRASTGVPSISTVRVSAPEATASRIPGITISLPCSTLS